MIRYSQEAGKSKEKEVSENEQIFQSGQSGHGVSLKAMGHHGTQYLRVSVSPAGVRSPLFLWRDRFCKSDSCTGPCLHRSTSVRCMSYGTSLYLLFFFVITGYDIYMVINDEQNIFPSWLGIALLIVSFLLLFSFLWVFPILSHFVNSVGGTLRNAVTMAIGAFPRTLLMLLILITPIAALYFIGQYIVPFLFLFGIEGPVYLCAMTYSKFFERFEPKREESQNPDAMPPVLADDLDSIDPNVFKIPGIDYDPDEVKAEESGEKDNESGKEMNQETEKAPDLEADKEPGRDADGTDK